MSRPRVKSEKKEGWRISSPSDVRIMMEALRLRLALAERKDIMEDQMRVIELIKKFTPKE